MSRRHTEPADEGERLRQYLERIIPVPLAQRDAYDRVVEPTGAAEAHRLFDWIETAMLPAIKRLRGAEMIGTMQRTVPAADYIPTLTVDAGSRLFEFEVLVIPMDNLVSFAWLYLKERRNEVGRYAYLKDYWPLGVLAEGPDGYEWRFIGPEHREMDDRLQHLPIEELSPLLPDRIRPYLEMIIAACVESELAWREEQERWRREGAG